MTKTSSKTAEQFHSPLAMRGGLRRPARRAVRIAYAFTLTELLVVIAVVGILMALLLPALSSAKRKAQQVRCLNNIRQVVLTSFLYVQDNDQYPTFINPKVPLSGISWVSRFTDANTSTLLFCPAAPLRPPPPRAGNRQGAADNSWVRWTEDARIMFAASYGYNSWLYADLYKYFQTNHQEMVFPKAGVEQPSLTPVLVDANWCDLSPKEDSPPARDLYDGLDINGEGGMGRCTISRHGGVNPAGAPRDLAPGRKMPGAINIGFADGHTSLVKLEELWKFTWHRDWQVPSARPL